MLTQWLGFLLAIVTAYLGISWFAQLTAEYGVTAWGAFLSAVRPLPLLIVTVANMFFGLGLYYGFGFTRFAIPAAISIGVVTSFVYSVFVLGAQVTSIKILGALMVILGVVILAI